MSSVSSSTGERVVAGRYRLRRRLGQGAMGTVWEAFDEFLRRPVAVKEVLLPQGLPDDQVAELRERTLREARAIAVLSHPNVVTLHDVAREGGEPFVVMEYMLAHSLAQLIDVMGPLPEARAATVADAVAAGLAAAHQAGITHRDVKPGNVLICADGRVKLTDFGIARNVAERTLTSTGIMLGSPAYIAPEVAAGREVTPAADLWGLGATLFAMIEGRPPYDVDGAVLATVNQVVNGEVPRPSSAGPLSEIVAALMVKEPADRLSLRELRNRLHPLLLPPSTPLLEEDDLALLTAATAEPAAPEPEADSGGDEVADGDAGATPLAADPGPVPLAADPGPVPSAPLAAGPGALPPALAAKLGTGRPPAAEAQLAATPGELPFEVTVRESVRSGRGSFATGIVAFLAVLLFFGAAAGGFALSRHIGGQPLLPPEQQVVPTATATPSGGQPDALAIRTGNAATITGAQGGGFAVPVPGDWVEFVEEIGDKRFVNSTRVYFVSPDGTQLLTVERLAGFYPKYTIAEYIDRLESAEPDVSFDKVDQQQIRELGPDTGTPDRAQKLVYRTVANAKVLVPDDANAQDQYRVTFANLWPYAGDLWAVSMTVPIEQEDSGSDLFDEIAKDFDVTG
jgi:tRNA A-37 threonylcarbamoyl transferase component Bud32